MDKYDAANDHYCISGTTVLRNKLGIEDESILEEAEREITSNTSDEITYQSPPYDMEYLQDLHLTLFEPLYDWAGCIRDASISKGGTIFCIPARILPESKKLFDDLESEDWFQELSREELCKKLAEYYCEFNMIHPFREGNGRVQRIFFEHLTLSTGYELDWFDVTKEEWIQANIDGVAVDYNKMEEIFSRILTLPE
jgi:cell filamentation protein